MKKPKATKLMWSNTTFYSVKRLHTNNRRIYNVGIKILSKRARNY